MSVLHAFESGMSLTRSMPTAAPGQAFPAGQRGAALLNEINGQGHVAGLDSAVMAAVKFAQGPQGCGRQRPVVSGDRDVAAVYLDHQQALGAVGTTVEYKEAIFSRVRTPRSRSWSPI